MKGSPIFRALLVVAALLVLLVPLRRLTKPVAATLAAELKPAPSGAGTVVHLALTSTRAPFEFEVCHLGRVIWNGESAGNQIQKDVSMEFPKEGVDLELKGSWAGAASMAAIKLSVAPDEAQPSEKSVWAAKEFDEVLTFP